MKMIYTGVVAVVDMVFLAGVSYGLANESKGRVRRIIARHRYILHVDRVDFGLRRLRFVLQEVLAEC